MGCVADGIIAMKIYFLVRALTCGGAERQLTLLAQGLRAHGHAVTVITFYSDGVFVEELKKSDVTIYSLKKKSRWDLFGFFYTLAKFIKMEPPDVLHSYLTDANLIAILLKIFSPKLKVVWGIRASNMDLSQYDWLAKLNFKISCWLVGFADLIIANSQAGKVYHVAQGFPADKTIVIPNGIDTVKFQRTASLTSLINNKVLVGVVARLDPMKDHETFIKAVAIVVKANSNINFICVGAGSDSYAHYLYCVCEKHGVTDYIIWKNSVTEMVELYNRLDLLVSTSITEGFSNVIAEAMACEVPCVVTDVGDSALIVQNENFVVPPRNPQKLVDAILRFFALSAEQRLSLGKQARKNIVERYSVACLIESTENNLLKLTNKNNDFKSPPPPLFQRGGVKIVHVITGLDVGGAENMLLKLLAAINKNQFQSSVISLIKPGAIGTEIEKLGLPVYTLNLKPGRFTLKALWQLRKLIKQLQPDILQGWMYHGNLVASLARVLCGKKIPVLWNIRQSLQIFNQEKLLTRCVIKLGSWLSRLPNKIIYNAHSCVLQHQQISYCSKKAIVIPNGFDTEQFKPNAVAQANLYKQLAIEHAKPIVIGIVGRYHPAKDQQNFLQAAALLLRERADVCFAMVGTNVDDNNDKLQSLIKQLGIKQYVYLLGESQQVATLMAGFDIFTLTSQGVEAFPNVIGEAMACGVPCVVTDVGDSALIVGDTGIVVPARDPQALMQAWLQLITMGKTERSQLGLRARQRVVDHYSIAAIAAQYETLYCENK
jgi:glycosyltransferase involved in cell wall biosynthesis